MGTCEVCGNEYDMTQSTASDGEYPFADASRSGLTRSRRRTHRRRLGEHVVHRRLLLTDRRLLLAACPPVVPEVAGYDLEHAGDRDRQEGAQDTGELNRGQDGQR